ncbi:hypothetical protein GALMADRAFT_217200 [Galerina marginata CBS 339.88]|uniref:Uncharacterized protein n=1 Tax=Galerina marginata (strain CBS 339.88) TaxID=685588 RepID=A0A067SH57_GALM3|nr:hypothetical protein GALMADRAFT_217200 [Galerina marginata CBS 339.88]
MSTEELAEDTRIVMECGSPRSVACILGNEVHNEAHWSLERSSEEKMQEYLRNSRKAGISGVNFVYFRENTWFFMYFKRLSKSARCRVVVIVIRDESNTENQNQNATLFIPPCFSPSGQASSWQLSPVLPLAVESRLTPTQHDRQHPCIWVRRWFWDGYAHCNPSPDSEVGSCAAGSELVDVDVEDRDKERWRSAKLQERELEELERLVRTDEMLDDQAPGASPDDRNATQYRPLHHVT